MRSGVCLRRESGVSSACLISRCVVFDRNTDDPRAVPSINSSTWNTRANYMIHVHGCSLCWGKMLRNGGLYDWKRERESCRIVGASASESTGYEAILCCGTSLVRFRETLLMSLGLIIRFVRPSGTLYNGHFQCKASNQWSKIQ